MFVQDFIKEDWVARLTIEDLEIMPVRFLNLRDGDRESDILYKLNLKEEEIFIFIHLEHQTKVNFLMPFRVMEYMTRIWRLTNRMNKSVKKNQVNEKDSCCHQFIPSYFMIIKTSGRRRPNSLRK
jgi:hypothetical protein